ncbi:hypothetical protein JCGZ_19545 [Jatropha curcas]|uniref:Uncharacterized protein n=1 Tax=Jatropha curcas TaxID=180498 RepID=A0A067JYF4_JATCU|nr:hypothetical protein JCGZ_19545 [Jatropha curcas]
MERGARIASMALAETIMSLDQAYRVDGIWSTSSILLQGLPPAGALFRDILISFRVTVAILGSWSRGAHVVEVGASGGRTATYEAWWTTEHGDREKERKATLTQEMDARLRRRLR